MDPPSEATIRAIVEAPLSVPHAELARQVGVGVDTCRRIRYGISWSEVLPELPRHTPRKALDYNCRSCRLFDGMCTLRYPESIGSDGRPLYNAALDCNSYFPARPPPG